MLGYTKNNSLHQDTWGALWRLLRLGISQSSCLNSSILALVKDSDSWIPNRCINISTQRKGLQICVYINCPRKCLPWHEVRKHYSEKISEAPCQQFYKEPGTKVLGIYIVPGLKCQRHIDSRVQGEAGSHGLYSCSQGGILGPSEFQGMGQLSKGTRCLLVTEIGLPSNCLGSNLVIFCSRYALWMCSSSPNGGLVH